MPQNRISGTLSVKIDGVQRNAIGSFSYNLGIPRKTALVGSDRVHGYMEQPQVPYFEGEIRDQSDLSIAELRSLENVTATLELANGKTIVYSNAWEASEGTNNTGEANLQIRMEALSAEEI